MTTDPSLPSVPQPVRVKADHIQTHPIAATQADVGSLSSAFRSPPRRIPAITRLKTLEKTIDAPTVRPVPIRRTRPGYTKPQTQVTPTFTRPSGVMPAHAPAHDAPAHATQTTADQTQNSREGKSETQDGGNAQEDAGDSSSSPPEPNDYPADPDPAARPAQEGEGYPAARPHDENEYSNPADPGPAARPAQEDEGYPADPGPAARPHDENEYSNPADPGPRYKEETQTNRHPSAQPVKKAHLPADQGHTTRIHTPTARVAQKVAQEVAQEVAHQVTNTAQLSGSQGRVGKEGRHTAPRRRPHASPERNLGSVADA